MIDDANYRSLAVLSDKYEIESLHMDVRNYAQRLTWNKAMASFDLWKFAARYALLELEHYCRSNKSVFQQLRGILVDERRGLKYLIQNYGISSTVLDGLVRDVAALVPSDCWPEKGKARCLSCCHCSTGYYAVKCSQHKTK
jgi:hypothetical protein